MTRLRLLKTLIIISGIFTLAACEMGPDFQSPPAPFTDSYTGSDPHHTKAGWGQAGKSQQFIYGKDIPAQWWTLFRSPQLNALIERGLANSPNLVAAKAALLQAEETLNSQTGSLMFPNVTGNAGATRARTSGVTFGAPNLQSNVYNIYNATVNVSYTFDFFGENRRQLESLAAKVDYQRYELAAAYLTLTSNIVTTAVSVAALQEQVRVTKQIIQDQENQLRILQHQFDAGGVSRADVLTQQTQVAQTIGTLPPIEKNLEQARHALATLVGVTPSEMPEFVLQLNNLHLPAKLPVTLPSKLVKQRPDVQASEAMFHYASAQVGVATANLFPQISLGNTYVGGYAPSPAGMFQDQYSAWSIGGQLAQPLFNGGALRAQRRASIAAYNQAAAQYKQTVLQAFQNVADSLKAVQIDADDLRAQQLAESSAYVNLRITRMQLKAGGVDILAVINAEKAYQQAVVNRVQAQGLRYNDTAALFQALGGGWWNADPTTISSDDPTHNAYEKL